MFVATRNWCCQVMKLVWLLATICWAVEESKQVVLWTRDLQTFEQLGNKGRWLLQQWASEDTVVISIPIDTEIELGVQFLNGSESTTIYQGPSTSFLPLENVQTITIKQDEENQQPIEQLQTYILPTSLDSQLAESASSEQQEESTSDDQAQVAVDIKGLEPNIEDIGFATVIDLAVDSRKVNDEQTSDTSSPQSISSSVYRVGTSIVSQAVTLQRGIQPVSPQIDSGLPPVISPSYTYGYQEMLQQFRGLSTPGFSSQQTKITVGAPLKEDLNYVMSVQSEVIPDEFFYPISTYVINDQFQQQQNSTNFNESQQQQRLSDSQSLQGLIDEVQQKEEEQQRLDGSVQQQQQQQQRGSRFDCVPIEELMKKNGGDLFIQALKVANVSVPMQGDIVVILLPSHAALADYLQGQEMPLDAEFLTYPKCSALSSLLRLHILPDILLLNVVSVATYSGVEIDTAAGPDQIIQLLSEGEKVFVVPPKPGAPRSQFIENVPEIACEGFLFQIDNILEPIQEQIMDNSKCYNPDAV